MARVGEWLAARPMATSEYPPRFHPIWNDVPACLLDHLGSNKVRDLSARDLPVRTPAPGHDEMTATANEQDQATESRPTGTPGLTRDQSTARGKQARADVPRASHAGWVPWDERPDPIALLEEQIPSREAELVPIRHGRMLHSPFAFFRGAAYIMASDLSRTPQSGIRAQLCGDAHLSNFGGFASPEREFLFALNDFDETLPGPWEWDLKRLAASFCVAGRHRGLSTKRGRELARISVQAYREAMLQLAGISEQEVWYSKVDASELERAVSSQGTSRQVKRLHKLLEKAQRKNSSRAFEKLAADVEGKPRIIADHPLIVPVEDLLPDIEVQQVESWVRGMSRIYRSTSRIITADCSIAIPTGTLLARSSGSVASARAPGSCYSSDGVMASLCFCRSRRPSGPCSSLLPPTVSTATWAGESSKGSG